MLSKSDLKSWSSVALLSQLQSGNYDVAFSKPDPNRGMLFPHWSALSNYMDSAYLDEINSWRPCLRALIAKNIPVNQEGRTVANLFCTKKWPPVPMLTADLMREYIAAGLFDIHRPIQVDNPGPFGQCTGVGRLPLSVFIHRGNCDGVRVLCEAGVSMSIGPVVANGPDRDALEYAIEVGNGDVVAFLTEHVMRQRMKSSAGILGDHALQKQRRRLGAI